MYEYFDMMGGDYLEHHGVKGQKWGVRRYQNYDGTRIGAKRRIKRATSSTAKVVKKAGRALARTTKSFVKNTKKAVNKAITERKESIAENAEKAKASAIARGDLNAILKYRGNMSMQEFNDAFTRATKTNTLMEIQSKRNKALKEARKQKIDDLFNTVTKTKETLEKLKEITGKDSKKDTKKDSKKDSKKSEQKNQNGTKSTSNSEIDELTNLVKSLMKERDNKQNNQSSSSSKDNKQNKKSSKLDLYEYEDAGWTPPNFSSRSSSSTKVSQNRESYLSKLSKIPPIFKDTTPSKPSIKEQNDAWIAKLGGVAKDMTIEKIKKRNESGWTAKNNDEWLSVLSDASYLKGTDGEWNKYNKYK